MLSLEAVGMNKIEAGLVLHHYVSLPQRYATSFSPTLRLITKY
jgi:hypothetical protein